MWYMGLPWCQHFSWRPGGFHFFNPKMHMLFFIRVSYRIVKYENLKHQFWHWYWTHWNVGSEQDCPKVILKDMRLQDSLRYCFPRPDMIHKNACLVHIYIYIFIYLFKIGSKGLHNPSNYTIKIIQIPWSFSSISTTPHYELMTASNIRVHCVRAWICVFLWSLEKIENTKSPNWWLMCGYKKRPNNFYSLEILLNGVTVNALVLQALDLNCQPARQVRLRENSPNSSKVT